MEARTRATLACVPLLLLLGGAPARGGFLDPDPTLVCRLGRVPARTLLLPYFEVHAKQKKADTQLVVQNAGPAAILARVTLWTDRAIPVLAFDLPLTGFDTGRLSLFETLFAPAVLASGEYASLCGEPRAELDAACLEQIRAALSGGESPPGGGQCVSWPHGDGRYRGYLTIDSTGGGAEGDDVLLGDFELREKKSVVGGPLVHVRASEASPLAPVWGARFENALATAKPGGPGTELLVWRDVGGAFPCGTLPDDAEPSGLLAFDEQSNPETLDPGRLLPLAAQRVRLGSEVFPLPFAAGWLHLDLNDAGSPGGSAYVASLLRSKKGARYVEGAPLCAEAPSPS